MSQKSVQAEIVQSVQSTDSIQGKTKYIKGEEVLRLAERIWDNEKRGITFRDVKLEFNVPPSHAQRTIKKQNKYVLFTRPDRTTQHQVYYPETRNADVIEYFKSKSVPPRPSWVGAHNTTLVQSTTSNLQLERLETELQEGKADNLVEVLLMMPNTPMYIHKILLELWVPTSIYDEVSTIPGQNKQKVYNTPIGPANVTYVLSRNGRVQISIECSEHPFPMASEADEQAFFVYIGKVQNNLQYWLRDLHERHTPPVMSWYLKHWDINWDVPITDKAQVTMSDIQLSYLGRVFRTYVKNMAGKAVYRVEEAVEEKRNTLLVEAISNLRNPNKDLEAKVDRLTALVEKFLDSNGATMA